MMKCKVHRGYRVIRRPRSGCGVCWVIWMSKQLAVFKGRKGR
jgi:hypothetical protein